MNKDKLITELHIELIKKQQENNQLKIKSDVLEENNKLLIQQKAQMYEELDIAYERIHNAIEEINYMITNVDISEISAIKLKQILGYKKNYN